MADPNAVTSLLRRASNGEEQALDELLPVVYSELRRIAQSYLRRERPDHTLQPTALVHEAYLRLSRQAQPDYANRSHFYGTAAQVMRQVLVDYARSRTAAKRGGGAAHVEYNDESYTRERAEQLLSLDDAITALATFDQRKANLIEMRYFGGLSVEECSEALDLPAHTVYRELRLAHAWLERELASDRKVFSATNE